MLLARVQTCPMHLKQFASGGATDEVAVDARSGKAPVHAPSSLRDARAPAQLMGCDNRAVSRVRYAGSHTSVCNRV